MSNPYQGSNGGWFWRDVNGLPHGPYVFAGHALTALLEYCVRVDEWRDKIKPINSRVKIITFLLSPPPPR
jgi:hypothetical protein